MNEAQDVDGDNNTDLRKPDVTNKEEAEAEGDGSEVKEKNDTEGKEDQETEVGKLFIPSRQCG